MIVYVTVVVVSVVVAPTFMGREMPDVVGAVIVEPTTSLMAIAMAPAKFVTGLALEVLVATDVDC